MGIQNLTIKKRIPLIPLLLGIRNMMYPPKDQSGDTVFDGDTLSDVTPVLVVCEGLGWRGGVTTVFWSSIHTTYKQCHN